MDKLRALHYFNLAVETGSFAAAARALDVSTPAVTQLVAALERSLGTTLLRRTTRGVSLTSDGERYHDVSRMVAANLQDIEKQLGPVGAQPRGSLTVVMFGSIGQNCVMPRIWRFLARFPDVALTVKRLESLEDIDRQDFDVAIMTGWPPDRDFVVLRLAQSRNMVCASPQYWKRHGKPSEPEDLRNHHCLVFRSVGNALLDRWTFEKNGEQRTINVTSRLFSDSSSWVDEAACAGAGVLRRADLSLRRYLSAGLLIPVLTDWVALDAPSHFALYRPGQRQSKLVRVFLDFLVEIYAEIERERTDDSGRAALQMPKPEWFGRTHGHQSNYAAHRRIIVK